MAEKKKEERTETEKRLGKLISKAISEEMGDIPKVTITVERLEELARIKRRAQRRKTLKLLSIAAIAVIVCAGVVYTVWPETAVPVDADKNTEQKVEENDGGVVINEGDGNGKMGIVSAVESDWSRVPSYKNTVSGLLIPGYIPEGYRFVKLSIEKFEDGIYECEYLFQDNDKASLFLVQTSQASKGNSTDYMKKYDHVEKSIYGNVYVIAHEERISGTIIKDHERIFISGRIPKKELIKIFDGLK